MNGINNPYKMDTKKDELRYNEGLTLESQWLNASDEKIVKNTSKVVANWFSLGAMVLSPIRHTTYSSFVDFWNPIFPDFAKGLEPEGDEFPLLRSMVVLSGFRVGIFETKRRIAGIMNSNGGMDTPMTKKDLDTINKFGELLRKELKQIIEGKQKFVPEQEEETQA